VAQAEPPAARLSTLSDEDLALLVRKRDELAFETLLTRHEERVFHLALRIVGRAEEARDVAQEVFLGYWEDPGAYRPTAKFTTWLYRVTSNRSISHLRSRSIRRIFSFSDNDPTEVAPDPDESADDRVVREERDATLSNEINRLPPRQRAALHLRYEVGLPVIEVAESLGISFKSAESLLFRAKSTLRDRLNLE